MSKIQTLLLLGFAAGYVVTGLTLAVRGLKTLLLGERRMIGTRKGQVAERKWKRSWLTPEKAGGATKTARTLGTRADALFVKADAANSMS